MSNIEKIKAEIERRAKFHDDAMKACVGLTNIALTHSAGWKEDTELLAFIDSLPEEHSFKPTQEQLDALDTVYKTHGADNACRHILLNLLNQLKELL